MGLFRYEIAETIIDYRESHYLWTSAIIIGKKFSDVDIIPVVNGNFRKA